MTVSAAPEVRLPRLSLRLALVSILLVWLAYTILYTWHPGDAWAAILEFLPGLLGLIVLSAAGFSLEECYLRSAPITRTGLVLLAISMLFTPLIWLTGRWVGWNALAALVYAPASGISQELFFRASLLPVFIAIFKSKPWLGITIHALLFALWHAPTTYLTAPLGGLIAVVMVTFICGLLWGKQVQHDRTVLWLMGYHSLILFVNSFLTWG